MDNPSKSIIADNLTFAYPGQPPILKNINLSISPGTYVTLMGPNGSGKSTLALLIKGILTPSSGSVTVDGLSSMNDLSHFEIMKRVGLVFQNPESTIVTTTVETELAFGLENLGVPRDEMNERVNETLQRFDLGQYRHTNPTNLSGGEKQRLALASVMIMKPSYLILDEPTALLDPQGQKSLLDSIQSAVRDGSTVMHITQFSFEALISDRLIVLDESGVCFDGKPADVLSKTNEYRSCGIEFMNSLGEIPVYGEKTRITTPDDIVPSSSSVNEKEKSKISDKSFKIVLEGVSYSYDKGTPFEKCALNNVSLTFTGGTSTVLFGASGSGKSTLLEIAAGITSPTGGKINVNGNPVRAMAFQLPEDQVSGNTVESYIDFGPRNTGIPESELDNVISEALLAVGLEPDEYRKRDPFTLSGGEKRRVALAGVLAMRPEVIVLDEPTAGLDRRGMDLVIRFLEEYMGNGCTLLFSTHDFEVARCLGDNAVVLDHGCVETYGKLFDVLKNSPWLNSLKS